jgi:predicted nucleic acid-binding Zn ribbon protein
VSKRGEPAAAVRGLRPCPVPECTRLMGPSASTCMSHRRRKCAACAAPLEPAQRKYCSEACSYSAQRLQKKLRQFQSIEPKGRRYPR